MTTPMTASEIEALRALERKATPGEWVSSDDFDLGDGIGVSVAKTGELVVRVYGSASSSRGWSRTKTKAKADAAFIVAARNAIPRLLATIDAQRAEIERKDALLHAAREQLGGTTAILLPILEQLDVDIDATTITINRVGPAGKTPVEQVSLRVLVERNAALDTGLRAAIKEPNHD